MSHSLGIKLKKAEFGEWQSAGGTIFLLNAWLGVTSIIQRTPLLWKEVEKAIG
jgi:hypothetical protein